MQQSTVHLQMWYVLVLQSKMGTRYHSNTLQSTLSKRKLFICSGVKFDCYFPRIGFPMMIVTVTTAMVYLLTVHIALGWNITKCRI